MYKPLVAYVDRQLPAFGGLRDRLSQAFGGRLSHLHTFVCIRGSSCTSLWWHTWIVVCKPLVAYLDRRVQAFGGMRGSSLKSLLWFKWLAVHKPLVAD